MGINQRAQDLHALQPDPLEPRAEEVERYVAALQEIAESDPDLAGRQAWSQIRLAGIRVSRRRSEALDSLNRIFRLATLPEPSPDGPYDGLVVTTTTFAATDPALPCTPLALDAMARQALRCQDDVRRQHDAAERARASEARLAELPLSGHG